MLAIGAVKTIAADGHPTPVVPPPVSAGAGVAGLWLLMRSFASGCTAMTGVEAPGSFFARAFIKTPKDETMRELERLPGHTLGQALGINNRGQVVGLSCTPGFASCTAFLWEDGVIVDLNARVPGYDGVLLYANDINDAGEITGAAYLPATGETVAFKAVPRP